MPRRNCDPVTVTPAPHPSPTSLTGPCPLSPFLQLPSSCSLPLPLLSPKAALCLEAEPPGPPQGWGSRMLPGPVPVSEMMLCSYCTVLPSCFSSVSDVPLALTDSLL